MKSSLHTVAKYIHFKLNQSKLIHNAEAAPLSLALLRLQVSNVKLSHSKLLHVKFLHVKLLNAKERSIQVGEEGEKRKKRHFLF